MDPFQSPPPSSCRDNAEPGLVSVTIPASPFMQKLGFGTGVSVYLMKRSPRGSPRSPWAVKKINSGCSQRQRSLFQRRLREEARTLRNLRHPNIVGYRALTRAPDGSLCLAMEFGGEKSLSELIEERRERGLGMFPAGTILHVALSMARGLQYLHMEQRLLHGDIKSGNVVVRGAFETVKICDVGVSLPLDENLTVPGGSERYVGTEPWWPPEALAPGGAISDRADIFAFGLTLWEMLALSVPHMPPDGSEEDSEDSWDEAAFRAALGSRPPLPPEALREPAQGAVRELFCACTARPPAQRPPAPRIVRALQERGMNGGIGTGITNGINGGITAGNDGINGGINPGITAGNGGITDGITAGNGGINPGITAGNGGITDGITAGNGGMTDGNGGITAGNDGITAGNGGITDGNGGITAGNDGINGGINPGITAGNGGMTDGINGGMTDGINGGMTDGINGGITAGNDGIGTGIAAGNGGVTDGITAGNGGINPGITAGNGGITGGITAGITAGNGRITAGNDGITDGNDGITDGNDGITDGNGGITDGNGGITAGNGGIAAGITDGNGGMTAGNDGITAGNGGMTAGITEH